MKSDPFWNEIRHHMRLEQPSDAFTDQVIASVQKERQLQASGSLSGEAVMNNRSRHRKPAIHQELMNALLAAAATFFFILSGAWSSALIGLQEGTFSTTIQKTVSNTIYSSIQLVSDVIHF